MTGLLWGATIELSVENMVSDQVAGLAYLCGKETHWIGVVRYNNGFRIQCFVGGVNAHGPELKENTIWLRTKIDLQGVTYFLFSFDGEEFFRLGDDCKLNSGF